MTRAEVGARLRAVIDDEKIGVRTLARELAADDDEPERMESWRRKLYKWLRGDHAPDPDLAVALALRFGKPTDYFVVTAEEPAAQDALLAVAERIEEIAARLEAHAERLAPPSQRRPAAQRRARATQPRAEGKR